ncbi:MAG TPA: hypothetical protein VKZ79_03600 [Alphaproteobacteria bacterium]|nr:hypothetical protein [Alphaproteobacteria bacterium]
MNRIQAHLEITTGIIRLYSEGSHEERAPFDMSLCLVGDQDRAILKGLATAAGFHHAHRRAINDCLKAHHFSRGEWERGETVDGRLVIRRVGFVVR